MLLTRVITGLILAPLAVSAVFFLPVEWFAVVFWAVAALGLYEWAGFLGLQHVGGRLGYVALYAAAAFVTYGQTAWYTPILMVGCILWVMAAIGVVLFPKSGAFFSNRLVAALLGQVIVVSAWVAIVVIHAGLDGPTWVVWLFLVVWGADIGAYFGGRAFGKHALAPAVSPAKTWEGVAGGVLFPGVVCGSAVFFWQEDGVAWLLVTFLMILVSVMGDLFESLMKRATGIKDSGTLLPGHGGMLDRIDSILAVLPVFAVVQSMMAFS